MSSSNLRHVGKVPAVTILFWITKILATTLGETAGDAVTMTLDWGYLIGTAFFATILIVAVTTQIRARRYHPALYWLVIVATTTCGTTLADFCDRSLGIGYAGGSTILAALLLATLAVWYHALGSVAVDSLYTPKAEMFYWATIMFSQTLGTALGDWVATAESIGYVGGAAMFAVLIAMVAGLYLLTSLSRPLLFWTAFILTRPLGATVGDFLDKPLADGGLNLGRIAASASLVFLVVLMVWLTPRQKPPHAPG